MRMLTEAEYSELIAAKADRDKAERRAVMFGDILSEQIIAMRAAVVAGKLEGLAVGLQWIVNTLEGPGHIPDLGEACALGGAQALFDKERADHDAFRAAHPGPAPLALEAQLQDLLWQIQLSDYVLTVEQKPLTPLAMGHYETVYSLRAKRGS